MARLGSSRELDTEYLTAEFGEGPRPSWLAAAVFLSTGVLVATSIFTDAAIAYRDGILAANLHTTGTYTWSGIHYLQTPVHYHFVDGSNTFVGGAFSPLLWLLGLLATVLVGRLWRQPAVWRRRADEAETDSELHRPHGTRRRRARFAARPSGLLHGSGAEHARLAGWVRPEPEPPCPREHSAPCHM